MPIPNRRPLCRLRTIWAYLSAVPIISEGVSANTSSSTVQTGRRKSSSASSHPCFMHRTSIRVLSSASLHTRREAQAGHSVS